MSAKNYRLLFLDFIKQVECVFTPGMNHGLLYFAIGNFILDNEDRRDFNREMLYRLFRDLQKHLNHQRMSMPNPVEMRKVAAAYRPLYNIIHEVALQWLTWEHHSTLISRIKDPYEQMFYLELSYREGWSCQDLLYYIESDLFNNGGHQ